MVKTSTCLTKVVVFCVRSVHVVGGGRKNEIIVFFYFAVFEKVQVGKDQEKAHSEKDFYSKN